MLGDIDGLKEVRHKKLNQLKQLLTDRLDTLQSPADCSKARKLLCKLNKGCGYGCQMHHAVYCLIVAYATKRTLLLDTNGWRYMPQNGWEGYFKPLSTNCKIGSESQASPWDGHNDADLLVHLPISDGITRRPSYLPLAIPKDMSETLLTYHGHPFVWFVGHMMRYLLRWQSTTQNFIDDKKKELKFDKPIVGIHVRRTDKINSEAALHNIEEYMVHVEEYYQKLKRTTKVPVKRVFIATDEPKVVDEARKRYKDYVFVSDAQASKSAALSSRYSDQSLRGIILDIEILAQTDYLVCTFSSQVCRLAYEIMQTYHDDASQYFHSLDDIYYFGGQNMHRHKAIYPHAARRQGEIDLAVGDIIAVAGNHWDGYSKGRVQGKGWDGLYPSYKTEDVPDIGDFAAYN
ncbi:uncharacterized protein TRIADDRAFT_49632 [Trichoplax adhaerens]|uniref:Uncharacterized protein n=1 Tax=Trichoplax adhaerens TaxID=10228 RepID=B3RKV6_TRIAD|nr:hypothetical protein TRIADDRAFT_49632 [Trichoplax adhaerens]EDV29440.1 hypothetical protein TRIADDRAFT_49632 [Trichoplax adhaerens]|eukprot:XP_002108642.1 hypothetical protein TRIADDRAFT_49632 [Trichoplax adhaerens]